MGGVKTSHSSQQHNNQKASIKPPLDIPQTAVMYKVLIFLLFIATTHPSNASELEVVESLAVEDKSGSLTLSNTNTNSFLSNAIYVVPVLLAIILVDFAIFGAFASRSDDLNPVSNF